MKPCGSGVQPRPSRWLLAPDSSSALRAGARETAGPGFRRGLSRHLRRLFLLLLQSQLINYVQMAIDNMAQQCCSSAPAVPQSMGLFSKLDLIQVRAPRFQAGPTQPIQGAVVVRAPRH